MGNTQGRKKMDEPVRPFNDNGNVGVWPTPTNPSAPPPSEYNGTNDVVTPHGHILLIRRQDNQRSLAVKLTEQVLFQRAQLKELIEGDFPVHPHSHISQNKGLYSKTKHKPTNITKQV